ncbi:uncharacterized protein TRUGW13939_09469 [Talaromyces rugulosus]|uniref:Mitochondrial outer membrane protein n=1 Tax=Talaromyces rugulosus TaxID=121627 RepID=A0A7H8R7F9_TALRU|nr:uncharacterized protein TRUGW13939_09469 [Talaromyces rugulosus]QKX62310.1 hypothetical protein TRUGW13939_09469 [Talaromyces rugulosus]
MPPKSVADGSAPAQHDAQPASTSSKLFAVPAPIKSVFDRFPLVTYQSEDVPLSRTGRSERNRLFVFIDPADAKKGAPSFNPQCLKWQSYLKFVGIDFDLVSSNNHASPTGALPFLHPALPAASLDPIPSNKIQKWAIEQVHCEEEQQLNMRFDVYMSLLEHRIRTAWLYQLYLNERNFTEVARKRYIDPSTTNSAVQTALALQLQHAARDELLKQSDFINVSDLEADAGDAFQALSNLLGDGEFFFGRDQPGLFDASVFAYTHLILEENLKWKSNPLAILLSQHKNLVQHQQKLFEKYF